MTSSFVVVGLDFGASVDEGVGFIGAACIPSRRRVIALGGVGNCDP